MRTRAGARTTAPYVDVELDVASTPDQLVLVRSVGAALAHSAGGGSAYADRVRVVAGALASALMSVAADGATMHVLYRMLDREVRLRVSVRGRPTSSSATRDGYARIIDRLVEPASTLVRTAPAGDFELVSDAVIS